MAMQPMRVWYTPRMVSVVEVFMKKERKGLAQFRSPLHSLYPLTVKVLNIASVQSGAVGTYAGEPSNMGELILGLPSAAKKLVSVVDITGREVNPEPNQLLFFIYEDGTVEKRYFLR